MKRYYTIVLVFILSFVLAKNTPAQINNPVIWSFKVNKITEKTYEFVATAVIESEWKLYSINIPKGGPLPTTFNFTPSEHYKLIDKVVEDKQPEKKFDPDFKMEVSYHTGRTSFKQRFEINDVKATTIEGSVECQACIESRCVFLEKEFSVKIDKKHSAENIKPIEETKSSTSSNKVNDATNNQNADKSLLVFFLISFLSGLLAILTPCVFPMIPMTVSFFMHGNKTKAKSRLEAIFYGLSIVFIYVVLGLIVAVTLGPSFANFLSTHWLPNIIFFLIFLVFACSFFGMFEIVLPSWLVNKSDGQVEKGGLWGAFFMAFTLVLVSFSCTGPIVGAVLVESAGGEFLKPIVGMLGFSLSFALPFTLFAFFPSWLSNLPKSGGWLNTVKVVLGFIELALGLKFLSMADLTYHWGLLDREVYLAFWIVLTFLLGFYLLGKLKFAHDSDLPKIGVPRLILAIFVLTFGVYMIPGLWGAPLKALSGYIPPMTTQDFNIKQIVQENTPIGATDNKQIDEKPLYSDFLKIPHGIKGYFDWDQALSAAKKQGKPIFVDFTGHGCANCRKMEENVWVNPDVLSHLKNDYIVLSLYVDDKTELPKDKWITTPEGKVKKTIGSKNSYIQETLFKSNSQPHYVIIDANGKPMEGSWYFNMNVDEFKNYLAKGLANIKN